MSRTNAATKIAEESADLKARLDVIAPPSDIGYQWLVVQGTAIVDSAVSMHEARALASFLKGARVKNVHTNRVVFYSSAA